MKVREWHLQQSLPADVTLSIGQGQRCHLSDTDIPFSFLWLTAQCHVSRDNRSHVKSFQPNAWVWNEIQMTLFTFVDSFVSLLIFCFLKNINNTHLSLYFYCLKSNAWWKTEGPWKYVNCSMNLEFHFLTNQPIYT